jgi:hypothetical protein
MADSALAQKISPIPYPQYANITKGKNKSGSNLMNDIRSQRLYQSSVNRKYASGYLSSRSYVEFVSKSKIFSKILLSAKKPSNKYSDEAYNLIKLAFKEYAYLKNTSKSIGYLQHAANLHKQAGNQLESNQVLDAIKVIQSN